MGFCSVRFFLSLLLPFHVFAQITSFPYTERFDSVEVPALPSGWSTTTHRLVTGDFFTTTTSPRSIPFAVQSTNSTISQELISPVLDFRHRVPGELRFFLSRSGTHTSGVLVEASLDNGNTWPLRLSDTLQHPGSTGYGEIVLALPRELSAESLCRIRWRVVGGIGGTSGTLRIDDVSVTVHTAYDLSLSALRVLPDFPTTRDELAIVAVVRSLGLLPVSEYTVDFFLDQDGDGRGSLTERVATAPGRPLMQNDSAEVAVAIGPLSAGEARILASLSFQGDESSSNDTVSAIFHVGVPRGAVIVNEIMYAPGGDEPEWVEISNTTSIGINVRDWKISDSRPGARALLTRSDVLVPPFSHAIVAKDSSFFLVHDSVMAPIMTTGFSALNNTTPDAVVLFDQRGITMDSVWYEPSWGGSGGRSLERIDIYGPSADRGNWRTSEDFRGSTPGRDNSVAIAEYDLMLHSLAVFSSTIAIQVLNAGRRPVETFDVAVTMADGKEVALFRAKSSLPRGGIATFTHEWTDSPPGTTMLYISILCENDQRAENNIDSLRFFREFRQGTIVINEIMFEPHTGMSEWIEMHNPGAEIVDVTGWRIADTPTSSGSRNTTTIQVSWSIPPGGYIVLAADSTILHQFPDLPMDALRIANQAGGLGLGNDGDSVVLLDPSGATIDSVAYFPSWHHKSIEDPRGRSLEKLRPDLGSNDARSWSTSAAVRGGTPGTRNSLYTPANSSFSTLSFSPNPFSPDGDGHEDFCIVRFSLPLESSIIRVRIFDRHGRAIRTLAEAELAGPEGELVWDGLESGGRRASIGPYIVVLDALGADGGRFSARGVVVVGAKL
ncbi:MAG: lamin tail domain-containing protein [Ignavibacterium sp.]|jgi:hypothetical protein